MSFIIRCECNAKLEVADRKAGSQINCPRCKTTIDLPANPAASHDQAKRGKGNVGNPLTGDSNWRKQQTYAKTAKSQGYGYVNQGFAQTTVHQAVGPNEHIGRVTNKVTRPSALAWRQGNFLEAPPIIKFVAIAGFIFGSLCVLYGVFGTFTALAHLSTVRQSVRFSGMEQHGRYVNMAAGQHVMMSMLAMLAYMVYGGALGVGAYGLGIRKLWGWIVVLVCGAMAALAFLYWSFDYIMFVYTWLDFGRDRPNSRFNSFRNQIMVRWHMTYLIVIFCCAGFAVISLWLLLKEKVRRAYLG